MRESAITTTLERLDLVGGEIDNHEELWVHCPLPFGNHKNGDANPSFSINLRTGMSNCFVCGGGDLYWLVSNIRGIDRKAAKLWVDGIDLGQEDERDFRDRILDRLHNQGEPAKHSAGHSIVEELEWDGPLGSSYHPWLAEQGISETTAKKFNLFYDADRNVIAFPHYWLGKLVGMQFRNLNWGKDDVRKTHYAKYYNTPGFPKKNTLFNYDHVEGDTVLIVESPKTVCVLDSRGWTNVIGTFGAGVGYEQMAPLWKFRTIFIWPDNDSPGIKSLHSAIKLLKDHCELWIIPPVSKEKGDAADIGKDEMETHLLKALPYLRYINDYKIYK